MCYCSVCVSLCLKGFWWVQSKKPVECGIWMWATNPGWIEAFHSTAPTFMFRNFWLLELSLFLSVIWMPSCMYQKIPYSVWNKVALWLKTGHKIKTNIFYFNMYVACIASWLWNGYVPNYDTEINRRLLILNQIV